MRYYGLETYEDVSNIPIGREGETQRERERDRQRQRVGVLHPVNQYGHIRAKHILSGVGSGGGSKRVKKHLHADAKF